MTCDVRSQVASCDVRLQVASCDVRSQVAMCRCELILLKLAMCVRAVHFYACDVQSRFRTFFSNNVRYEDENALSFGVYYNSVVQKLSLLVIQSKF